MSTQGLKHIESTKKYTNEQYRVWFRENGIPKTYNPILHVAFNIGTLLALIVWNMSFVTEWNWEVFSILGTSLIIGNLVVYLLHKYPLHRRMKLWSFPYDAHTVEHHRYFTYDNPVYNSPFDFFAVFFPWFVVLGFALVAQPIFYFSTKFFIGPELAHVFAGATAGYFLLYEFVHWSCHLREDHPLLKVGWLNYMWKFHRVHHNQRLMNSYNFSIVYPLFDILMGTLHKGDLPGETIEDHYKNVKENIITNPAGAPVESTHQ
ncbi:MAG: sterol desaturase family protein [Bacteriovoracaceae bacterium]|nr:sterol desaturase family protein [Bacteriovoracaceae bacterium]